METPKTKKNWDPTTVAHWVLKPAVPIKPQGMPSKTKIQNPPILAFLGGHVPYIYCHVKCSPKFM